MKSPAEMKDHEWDNPGMTPCGNHPLSSNPKIRREIFVPSPRPGVTVIASSFYTRPKGLDLVSIHELMMRSDTVEVADFRYSNDNGRTWTNGEQVATFGLRPSGKLRRCMRGCVVDPATGRLLSALQLSSPSTREDRETGEILLNLTRFSEFAKDAEHDWTANAYLYRIAVD